MEMTPIRNEEDYSRALAEIARYFDHQPVPGRDGAIKFEMLPRLIERYEAVAWPIEPLSPIE